ncbi:MAG TPA: cation-transporting P-type ATPase [Desulfobacteria bacterium]|nr:cation-transporting P-type ATPase [Desulfobacteria bacterium]
MEEERTDVHETGIEEVYKALESSPEGLPEEEVKKRFLSFGSNEIQEKRKTPLSIKFLKQFFNFFAILLWIAGGLAFLGEYLSPGEGNLNLGIAIIGVIFINAVFTFYQEYKAERAAEALKMLLAPEAKVIRSKKELLIPAREVVVGDIILLSEGDRVPADGRLTEQYELKVNNAPLTGESLPQTRSTEPERGELLEAKNAVFSGTTVVSGSGRAVVFATGMGTEFGKIAGLTQEIKEEKSPLQKELAFFIKVISAIAVLLGIVFFFTGWVIGRDFTANFIFAIGIIIANVPEGLLPTVTLTLSIASQRMAKRNALIKSLNSVETLGSTTVICTDKTGTLTQNEMTVNKIFVNDRELAVTGSGYHPEGTLLYDNEEVSEGDINAITPCLKTAFLCNSSQLTMKEGKYVIIGDPTDGALLVLAKKFTDTEKLLSAEERIFEIPFTSERQMMSTIYKGGGNKTVAYVKGAPESILLRSSTILIDGREEPLSEAERNRLEAVAEGFEKEALRTIALAYREVPLQEARYTADDVEHDLVFLGFAGMIDPPRTEVREAVMNCKRAGIKIILITGDNKLTAEAIARAAGVVEGVPVVVEGPDINKMDRAALKEILKNPEIIFARTAPKHKMDIVMALKEMGEVVAVTGDGVNDAPALKEADIGIAMGAGTDVAKEAADVILIDDNFKSIVDAVMEGRTVFDNIKKFVTYILTSNIPEIVPFLIYVLFSVPLPLTVIQILAIDLGTDMVPAIAIGTEPPEVDIMERPPRPRKERMLTLPTLLRSYGFIGPIEAAAGLLGYWWVMKAGGWVRGMDLLATDPLYIKATTMALAAIIICQIANGLQCRSLRNSIFKIGFFTNRYLFLGFATELLLIFGFSYLFFFQRFLGTGPLELKHWLFFIPFAIFIFVVEEIRKAIKRRLERNKQRSSGLVA